MGQKDSLLNRPITVNYTSIYKELFAYSHHYYTLLPLNHYILRIIQEHRVIFPLCLLDSSVHPVGPLWPRQPPSLRTFRAKGFGSPVATSPCLPFGRALPSSPFGSSQGITLRLPLRPMHPFFFDPLGWRSEGDAPQ